MGVNVRTSNHVREASTCPSFVAPRYFDCTHKAKLSALHDILFSTEPHYLSVLHDTLISTEPRYLPTLHDTLFSTEPHYLPTLHDTLFSTEPHIFRRFTILYFLLRTLVQIYIRTLLFATNFCRSQMVTPGSAAGRLGDVCN